MRDHLMAILLRLTGRRYFDAAHFDRTYASLDPWDYATSPYEAARRAALMAALPGRCYRAALEVGCGEGHTTRLLADRADRVVGLDLSRSALDRAAATGPPHVEWLAGDLLGEPGPPLPAGGFDLVVCAEVLYYCYRLPIGRAARRARERLVGWLAPGGDLVLVHPRPETHWPFDRAAAGRALPGTPPLVRLAAYRAPIAPRPVAIAVYRRPDR